MKTEMKMIAAILAVLAVALGGVYVLDDAQAAGDNYAPAQWPGPSPEPAASYTDYAFYESTLFGNAVWTKDTNYVYWLDQTQSQGNWVTILGGTEVEINGTYESFRVKSQGPASADLKDFIVTDLEIKFYDDVHAGYAVVNSYIDNYPANKPLNLDEDKAIQTPAGTIYVDAMQVQLKGNLYQKDADGNITTTVITNYTKVVSIPVLVKKTNVSDDITCYYTFNGLMQSPIADLNTVGNDKANVYTYAGENPIPYIDLNNPGNYFSYPELPEGVEVTWEISEDSTAVAGFPNKYVAWVDLIGTDDQIVGMTEDGKLLNANGQVVTLDIKPYTIKITPTGSNLVNGTITITWWILPLGIDDIEFDIKDPYYDYDNEVRPTVAMRWYEPLDGPNTVNNVPAKHNLASDKYILFDYTMPEDYPYEMPVSYDEDGNPVYVSYVQKVNGGQPVYEMNGDEYVLDSNGYRKPVYEQETVMIDNVVYNVYEKQAVDEYGRPVYSKLLLKDGTPVYETVQVLDEYGNPVYVYATEEGTADSGVWTLMVGDATVYSHDAITYDLVPGEDGDTVLSETAEMPADAPNGAPDGAVWTGTSGNYQLVVEQPVYSHGETETTYDTTQGSDGVAVSSNAAEMPADVPNGAPDGAVWTGESGAYQLVVRQPVYSHEVTTYDTTQGSDGVAVTVGTANEPVDVAPTDTYGVEGATWVQGTTDTSEPVMVSVTDSTIIPTID